MISALPSLYTLVHVLSLLPRLWGRLFNYLAVKKYGVLFFICFWRAQVSSYNTNQFFFSGKDSVTWKNRIDGLLMQEYFSFNLSMIPAALIKNPSFTYDGIITLLIIWAQSLRIIFDSSSFLISLIQLTGKSGFFYF